MMAVADLQFSVSKCRDIYWFIEVLFVFLRCFATNLRNLSGVPLFKNAHINEAYFWYYLMVLFAVLIGISQTKGLVDLLSGRRLPR